MTMIETVSRAMCVAICDPDLSPSQVQAFADGNWRLNVDIAAAAIKAMREPTPAMYQAVIDSDAFAEANGIIAMHAARTGTNGLSVNPIPIAWRAMIEAALTENPE